MPHAQGHVGIGAWLSLSVTGKLGASVHLAPGVKVGDRVTMCLDTAYAPPTDASSYFEAFATADNYIKQVSGDLKGHAIAFVISRPT